MNNDPLRELWLQSEEDEMAVDVAELRAQSRELDRAVERRNLVEMFAAGVVVMAFSGWAVSAPTWLGSVGAAAVVVGVLLVAATLLRRGAGPAVHPSGSTLDFLAQRRAQLEHQAQLLERVPFWYVGPLLPGLGILAVSTYPADPSRVWSWVGSVLVQVLGVLGVLWVNRRAAADLRASIEALPQEPQD